MRVILPYVATINNKITKGDDPNPKNWSSKEDQEFFAEIKQKATLIIRTSKTHEASKEFDPPRQGRLVVVLTRDPGKYESETVPGQLEFTSESPAELVARLANEGHQEAHLFVGGNASAQFIKEGLVDDLYLTIEPLIFGLGTQMIGELDFEAGFELLEMKKLNDKGSIWLHYRALK